MLMWEDKNINAILAGAFVIYAFGFLFYEDPTFAGSMVGHGVGIFGTILILLTLIYPFKKRILKRKAKKDLRNHIAFGLIGPVVVIVHTAHKIESLIGTFIYLILFLVVFSGIIGRFLFQKVNRSLRGQKRDHKLLWNHLRELNKEEPMFHFNSALNKSKDATYSDVDEEAAQRSDHVMKTIDSLVELEYNIKFFDRFKILFSRWLRIHHFLAFFLFALIVVHALTGIYYGLQWLP
ncbi:MAG: hypothetical protein R6U50_09105 [Desulfobacterales bacterium]